ncbi:MAG: GNAT family N-acetyltransferase [Halanaerobiales bacterium]|nr:GNAT family N-acetyltransferase [Halanaerobiales bacterium]
MIKVRNMEWKDYQQISWIDQLAFAGHYKKTYGVSQFPERTQSGMDAYINCTGGEALVVEYSGQVVGFNFVHQWGSLGWFGPLGIDPNYQRRGLGKALLEKTLEIYEERQVAEIGLETRVDSPANIGMYMSMGFQPMCVTLDLTRTVKIGKMATPLIKIRPEVEFLYYKEKMNEADLNQLCEEVWKLTDQVNPGLDYKSELELLLKFGFGQVIVMKEEGEVCGLALIMTTDLRGQEGFAVTIRGLLIKPGTPAMEYIRLSELLQEVYQVTRQLKRSKVAISVYSAYDAVTRYLLKDEHFTISFPYLRMVMNDPYFPIRRGGIELSKWRG